MQWCHGAPGLTQLLAEVADERWHPLFSQQLRAKARETASRAADTIWERGLLTKVSFGTGVLLVTPCLERGGGGGGGGGVLRKRGPNATYSQNGKCAHPEAPLSHQDGHA